MKSKYERFGKERVLIRKQAASGVIAAVVEIGVRGMKGKEVEGIDDDSIQSKLADPNKS